MRYLLILHSVVVVRTGRCNNVRWTYALVQFTPKMSQHVATGWPNGRNMMCPKCCHTLRSNVTIVWLGLANTGPTRLECAVWKCCDGLAGALVALTKVTQVTLGRNETTSAIETC